MMSLQFGAPTPIWGQSNGSGGSGPLTWSPGGWPRRRPARRRRARSPPCRWRKETGAAAPGSSVDTRGHGVQGCPRPSSPTACCPGEQGILSPTGVPGLRKGITYGDSPWISRTLFRGQRSEHTPPVSRRRGEQSSRGRGMGRWRQTYLEMARAPAPMKLAHCCPLPSSSTHAVPSLGILTLGQVPPGQAWVVLLQPQAVRGAEPVDVTLQHWGGGTGWTSVHGHLPRALPTWGSALWPLHTHTHTHTHMLWSSSPATCPFHPGTGKVTKGTCPGPASAFPLSHPGMQFDEPTLLR